MRMIRRIIWLVLVVVLSLSACMSTHYLAAPEKTDFLTKRSIYVVLDDGTELKLNRCVLQEDLLIRYTRSNQRVEIELSRIRAAYYKKLKPGMPYLFGFTAGAAAVAVWLIAGALTAPSEAP